VEGVSSSGDGDNTSLEDEDSKLLLLEKEFEDFYEDQVADISCYFLFKDIWLSDRIIWR
jgi:hypothetical protein